MAIKLKATLDISLPDWVTAVLRKHTPKSKNDKDWMKLCAELVRGNIAHKTGGPFAAVLVDMRTNRLVEVGVNSVVRLGCSLLHAENICITRAQHRLKTFDLSKVKGKKRRFALYTSCATCAQCFGALYWAGIKKLVVGARKTAAERLRFAEGPVPRDYASLLRREKDMIVVLDVYHKQIAELMATYKGEIYSSRKKGAKSTCC